MTGIRQTNFWHNLISEPWLWLSHCFFQPVDFMQKTEIMSLKERLVAILRMNLVILLLSYPTALLVRTILCVLNVNFYPDYFTGNFSLLSPGIIPFYFDGTWPSILSCILAGLFGACFSLRLGIAAAFAVSLSTGINTDNVDYTAVGIVFGLVLGFIFGSTFNNIRVIKKDGLANVTLGSLTGALTGLMTGTDYGKCRRFLGRSCCTRYWR